MKRLTTLTGPSCAGKTTLESRLAELGAQRAISTTTRAPRAGEVDGVDYYFVSEKEFQVSRFVEKVQFGDHWYGLSVLELERLFLQGDDIVLVCEPTGAKQIRQYCSHHPGIELRQVFVDNPQPVIIDRFLRRFLQDIDEARTLGSRLAVQRVFEAQSKRLLIMSGIERGWVMAAYLADHLPAQNDQPGHFRYDRIIERFDESNIDEIATFLMLQNVPELA